jgi:putative Mg2+ transporter-C (MgtC) family protein
MIDWTSLTDILLRLTVAVVVGGLLGFERELHGNWAGMRTHMLVAMGAAIFTIAGVQAAGDAPADVTRIVQGIAAGIGFLGAGTILKLSDQLEVKGLTTASTVWLAAAMGTAAGLKLFELAVAAAIIAIAVLAVLRPIDKWFDRTKTPRK